MSIHYDEPVYLISVVSNMLSIHPQTLRQYEKEGLIDPSRTDGKMRLYSQRDVDKIKTILKLTRDLGVNLAGVDIILKLKDRLDELEAHNQNSTVKTESNESNNKDLVISANKSSYDLIILTKIK